MSSGNPPEEGQNTGAFPGVEIQDEENLTDGERDALFGYDPFAERQDDDNIPSLSELREEEAATEAPTEETPQGETPPVEAPAEPQMSDREQLLHEQNELLRRQLATTEAAARAATPPSGEEPPAQPGDNLPPYMFQVTDEYVEAVRSDNPEMTRRAIQGIMQGTARAVHQNLRSEYQEHVNTAVQNYVQRHATSSRIENTVMEDYYSTYPTHNNPALQPVVVGVAQKIMKETRAQAWTPDLRDKIGQGVNAILSQAVRPPQPSEGAPPGGGGQPAAAEAKQNTQSGAEARVTRPTGPAQTRPGSRPAPESPNETGAQIMDLFG